MGFRLANFLFVIGAVGIIIQFIYRLVKKRNNTERSR